MPEYNQGSIVNLTSSILHHLGGKSPYSPLSLLPPEQFSPGSDILLLVIDGLGYNFLEKYGKGTESVLYQHCIGKMTSIFPSTTAAAMTAYYTGYPAQNHGIPAWFTYFQELGAVTTILPFVQRGSGSIHNFGISIQDLLKFPSCFAELPSTVQQIALLPQKLKDTPFTNFLLQKTKRIGYDNLSHFFNQLLALNSTHSSPSSTRYVLAYWSDFDAIAHTHGVNSPEAVAHFWEIDRAFSDFITSLSYMSHSPMVIVSADHGLIDATEEHTIEISKHPILQESLTLPLSGEARAPFFYVRPRKLDQFEHYLMNDLGHTGTLHPAESLLDKNFFGLGAPHPKLRSRIGDDIMLMNENYIFRDKILGEKRHPMIGFHGGLSPDEMFVPVIVKQFN